MSPAPTTQNWFAKLDGLIAGGEAARIEQSDSDLNALLLLPLQDRWTALRGRDPRVIGLTNLDFNTFIDSLYGRLESVGSPQQSREFRSVFKANGRSFISRPKLGTVVSLPLKLALPLPDLLARKSETDAGDTTNRTGNRNFLKGITVGLLLSLAALAAGFWGDPRPDTALEGSSEEAGVSETGRSPAAIPPAISRTTLPTAATRQPEPKPKTPPVPVPVPVPSKDDALDGVPKHLSGATGRPSPHRSTIGRSATGPRRVSARIAAPTKGKRPWAPDAAVRPYDRSYRRYAYAFRPYTPPRSLYRPGRSGTGTVGQSRQDWPPGSRSPHRGAARPETAYPWGPPGWSGQRPN